MGTDIITIDLIWKLHEQSSTAYNSAIYQVYGYHVIYGPSVLLYIGITFQDIVDRLKQHEKWTAFEQNISFLYAIIPNDFNSISYFPHILNREKPI